MIACNDDECCAHLSDDGVYMESAADRNEYILCESGRIWAGALKAFHIWPWEFEQVSYIFNLISHRCYGTYKYLYV